IFSQLLQHRDHRQAADEFWNEAVADQIFRLDVLKNLVALKIGHSLAVLDGAEAHDTIAKATLDDFLQPHERAAADKQNATGVDANIFLLRMLAAALRRDIADRAFENLQQRLLHTFAAYVARDGNVLRLARDLV